MNEQYIKIDKYDNKFYYKDREMNILHREDGPAIEWSDGSKTWYLNGKRHRVDGPAMELAGGLKAWYLKGKLHREDGPAIEFADGTKHWCINGQSLTKEQHAQQITKEVVVSMDQIAKMLDIPVEKLKIKK